MGSACSELFLKLPCFKAKIQAEDQKISTLQLTSLCRRYEVKKYSKTMIKPNVIWILNKPFFASNGLWVKNISMGNGTYTGEMVNSKKHGIGTFYWNDGKVYKGQWEKNAQNGYGKMNLGQNKVYEGEWKDEVYHGFGVLICQDFKYVGEWEYGKKHGKGCEIVLDGSTYDGMFADGEKNGKGTLIFPNGSRYIGNFTSDRICGFGTYYLKDNKKYEGYWNNQNNGENLPGDQYCEENLINNLTEGNGTYVFSNGKKEDY
ncbi:hypothetical protein SteCoe_17736 [Stentor coeruleus]|uniref:MORN repeat protein n=1 Tax=Stentor coeruleus TaxID=5963 RepID=A0A1R2BY50_9CILI|nr:hypothetical protein SteCoe_17736 [Stentor coeruleus]